MFRALIRKALPGEPSSREGTTLCASTVGTFCPSVESGARVRPGMILGRIRRLGRWYDLLAPQGVEGFIEKLLPAWSPVEYGSPLYRLREEPAAIEPAAHPESLRGRAREKLHAVRIQLEGTLYRRPTPELSPFAPEGTRVKAQEIIALVEVMKTFTPVRAPFAGTLKRWLIGDGEGIQPGAELALLEPEDTSEQQPELKPEQSARGA